MAQPAEGTQPETAAAGTASPAEIEDPSAERLVLFSDAVVAIAITLLALDLPVPDAHSATTFVASVAEFGAEYVSFLVSFLVIGRHWLNHHALFRDVVRIDARVLVLNLAWLLAVVISPFMTRLLSEDDIGQISFGLYAGTQALLCVVLALLAWALDRPGLLRPGAPAGATRRIRIVSLLWASAFAVSVPVFALVAEWAFLCWWLVPAIGVRLLRRGDLLC
jgi:uncharacterized membrane protein